MQSYGGKYIQNFMGGRPDYAMEGDPSQNSDPSTPIDPSLPSSGDGTVGSTTEPTKKEDGSAPPVDNTSWHTSGYAKPGYTASNFGNAPSGWNQTKWADSNHQTPKYVVGRILMSVGDLKDPANRQKAIQYIQQAYPGATFDGKDHIKMPDGGSVDIFGGASAGIYSPSWQPDEAGGASGVSGDSGASGPGGYSDFGPNPASADEVKNTYEKLLEKYFGKNSSYSPDNSMRLTSGTRL